MLESRSVVEFRKANVWLVCGDLCDGPSWLDILRT